MIIVSALSLSLRDKEREREKREIELDNIRDTGVFKLKVESNHTKCLERQIKEGVSIKNFKNSDADIVMNSKAEFHQPAVRRVTTTREVGL